jgi:hypothetical protein
MIGTSHRFEQNAWGRFLPAEHLVRSGKDDGHLVVTF